MSALVLVLVGLAAARTHRLLTIDGAGNFVRNKFDKLIWRIMPKESKGLMPLRRKDVSKWTWRRWSLAKSLDEGFFCAYCAPFWYGLAWLGTGMAWGDTWPWQLVAGGFALSYVVGHVSSRIDIEENR